LHHAVKEGEKDRLDQLIQRVGESDKHSAEALQEFAENYEYDALTFCWKDTSENCGHEAQPMMPTENANIMVVDDQPANLKLLEDMLKVHGYKIRSFPRGRLALAAAAQNPSGSDSAGYQHAGNEWLRGLRAVEVNPELSAAPVIFLSALNATEDKVKAFQTGGADYITKPFQLEEVQARVQTHLKLHQLQQTLRLQNDHLEEIVAREPHNSRMP
jgi:PleD family two-component response regulator